MALIHMRTTVNIDFFSSNIRSFFRSKEYDCICNFLCFSRTSHRNSCNYSVSLFLMINLISGSNTAFKKSISYSSIAFKPLPQIAVPLLLSSAVKVITYFFPSSSHCFNAIPLYSASSVFKVIL